MRYHVTLNAPDMIGGELVIYWCEVSASNEHSAAEKARRQFAHGSSKKKLDEARQRAAQRLAERKAQVHGSVVAHH